MGIAQRDDDASSATCIAHPTYKRKLLPNSFPFNSYTSMGRDSQTQEPSYEHEQNHKTELSLFLINCWRSVSTNLADLFNIRTK